MVLNVSQCCTAWWSEVFKKVKKSVVFIDNSTAECLHWSGDLLNFYNAGAVSVKEFSAFESGEKHQKKAVFITSAFGNNVDVLKSIIESSVFEYCVLITTAHPSVLSRDRYDNEVTDNEMQAFISLENEMLVWMKNKEYTVEILYLPLFLAPVTSNFFVTPAFSTMFPNYVMEQEFMSNPSDLPFYALNKDTQMSIRHLVTLLHSLFGMMNLKDEIYSLGNFSGIVASMLDNFPACANRRKNATNSASLILVDRTLDLCTALSHNTNSLLDCIKLILPKFPNHSIDVAVDMSPVCKASITNVTEDIQLAPGCLAHPSSDRGRHMIEYLLQDNQKKILNKIYVSLSTINDCSAVKSPQRITLQSIEKLVNNFKGDYSVIEKECDLLQHVLGILQTLKSPLMSNVQLKMSLEQIILQNLSASKNSTSILLQLSQIIKSRTARGLTLDDIIILLLYVYSLAGTDIKFSESQEQELLETLSCALEGCSWISESNQNTKTFVTSLIEKLKRTSIIRKDLIKYKSLIHSPDKAQPAQFKGILQQLAEDLFNPTRPEMVDLASKSIGITDLLKSSLSLLMNKPKKQCHPMDNKLIIVFVIGGIRAHEIDTIMKLKEKSSQNFSIIIGSTQLTTPLDTMKMVLELGFNQ